MFGRSMALIIIFWLVISEICENPTDIDFSKQDSKDLEIITTNNKPGEEATNSLTGSSKSWTPSTGGSGIEYIINGRNNTVQFVDGSFETVNIAEITISLLDENKNVITSETVSVV